MSRQPIPIHFAFAEGGACRGVLSTERLAATGRHFDLPDLPQMDDTIANGSIGTRRTSRTPLALFTGPRVDYSLHRLRHYTGTSPGALPELRPVHQLPVLHRRVHPHRAGERVLTEDPDSGIPKHYVAFVEPGNHHLDPDTREPRARRHDGTPPARLPQMPAYHLQRADRSGITMVNIGVGPSNARTITDHIAVLRPHAWLMLGHCAGLRNTQRLGDYVLAHGYVREDHVLDDELPLWVPIPPLAEVQLALEGAVGRSHADGGLRPEAGDANRHGRLGRQPQLGTPRPHRRSSSASARAAPWRWTWKAPRSPPTASASACPTARCCASRTSRCTVN